LKDELRLFWEQPTYHAANRFLADWCRRAEASGIRILILKQAKVSLFFVEFFFAHPDWSRLGWVGFRVVNRAWRFILSVGF
jgi:hypothetical protein